MAWVFLGVAIALICLKTGAQSDKENIVGKKVMYDFSYDKETDTYKGLIYSIARESELEGQLILENKDELKVVGKKYFIIRNFYWTKYK